MEPKFLKSADYNQLLEDVKNEYENPFGFFRDSYLQNKERNPHFLQLSLNGIKRKQSKVWEKWMQIDYTNSAMTLEEQVYKDPTFNFFERLKNFIYELQNPKEEQKEIQVVKPKGNPLLTREQTAILFYYLREKSLIAPNPQNKHLSTAIELLTGYSAKQIADILTRPERPIYQLGKDQNGLKRNDLKELKNQLQNIVEQIDIDLNRYKDRLK